MKKSSWIVLGICVVLAAGLAVAYFLSQRQPTTLTQAQATGKKGKVLLKIANR